MSYTPSTLVACPNLQDRLDNVFANDAARFYIDPIPFSEFLMSPLNKNGLAFQVSNGKGKVRNVELTYQPRILQSEVSTNVSDYCAATTERGNTSEEYTIDTTKNLAFDQKFDVEDLKSSCEDNENWFADQIAKMIAALDTAVNNKNATQAAALLGGWSSDISGVPHITMSSDVAQVRTLQPSSTFAPFPSSMQSIKAAGRISNFGASTIVGGMQLNHYLEQIQSGCCADYGLDLGDLQKRFGLASVYDRYVADAAGGDEFSWMVANGSLQVLHYNRWTGLFGKQDANNSYGVVYGRLGIPYDISIKHDCGTIQVSVVATTKLVALPDDMYQTGDHLDGVKGFAAIEVDNS
jgi:hypothetical protein